MNKSNLALTVVISVLMLTAISHSASITLIGGGSAKPGEMIDVPVQISAATDIAGLNLRLDFDPSAFSSPSVAPGPLLASGRLLDSYAPPEIPGRVNIAAYAPAGGITVDAMPAVVFTIRLQVSADAEPGDYAIAYAEPLSISPSLILTPSGLSDRSGNSLEHDPNPAQVTVLAQGEIAGDLDGDGLVSDMDLFLLSTNWWHATPLPLAEADLDGDSHCDTIDLLLFIEQWHH